MGEWLLAAAPIIALVALVSWGRLKTSWNSVIAVVAALAFGAVAFGAGVQVLVVGVGKGLWTGTWILYVVWPALLLFQFARGAGLLGIGGLLARLLPEPVENILIIAWVFPSFIQGIAGFGTPIAVAAPLLLVMGVRPVLAVALPLIGYHWSVTFGSMGSSFYMGGLTADLDAAALASYGQLSALMLGLNALIAGALVCVCYGGLSALRQGLPMLAFVGLPMAVALQVAVQIEPATGSVAAGAVGLVAVALLAVIRRRRIDGRLENPRAAFVVLLPYAYLLILVLAVFLPTASRNWVKSHLLLGPAFPGTATAQGFSNEAVDLFTPIALLGHPGSYVLVAAIAGFITYRLAGRVQAGELGGALREWGKQGRRSSVSVLLLAVLATVLVDTGMIRTVATGAATVTGGLFPVLSPLVGALGAFMTGSTTNSNALFAALQRDVAVLIDVPPIILVAAQTVGGNIGNSLAPVIILVGASSLGEEDLTGRVFRTVIPYAVVLAGVVVVLVLAAIFVG